MVKLELNENQAQVLIQLLDMAVKAGGLNAVEAASFFAKQIQTQIEAEAPQEEPSK